MASSAGGETVYLSPHLDDAVLSCGGRIAAQVRAGRAVRVVTPFTADEPADGVSELAAGLHRLFRLRGGVVAARRAEDVEACRRLRALHEHWGEAEAVYRRRAGEFPYPDLERLFGAPRPADDELAERLAERLRGFDAASEVVCPLAIGGHVDHRLVRRAAEAARGPRLIYYEDYPYVERRPEELERAVGEGRLEPIAVSLAPAELEAKLAAIAAYRSQLRPLFGGRWRMARAVRRFARRRGGERLWRPAAGSAGAGR